jgi:hypothetical protein
MRTEDLLENGTGGEGGVFIMAEIGGQAFRAGCLGSDGNCIHAATRWACGARFHAPWNDEPIGRALAIIALPNDTPLKSWEKPCSQWFVPCHPNETAKFTPPLREFFAIFAD